MTFEQWRSCRQPNDAREMAGVEGLEPTALGFGDRCSTN